MAVEITAFFIGGPKMTVQVSDRLSQLYVGNGVNTRFDFMFRAYEQEDETGIGVRVKVGNDFEFIDESEYAVTFNPDAMGGYVTFVEPPSVETFFYVAGKTPVDQLLDITNYDNFYPDAIERALDKLTAILQEWKHLVDFETQARILADIDYDELAKQREADLKAYIDGIASAIIGQPVVGLPAQFVQDGPENQKEINSITPRFFSSVEDLLSYSHKRNGLVAITKSYRTGLNKGGSKYVYDSSKANINNDVTIIGGWVLQYDGWISVEQGGAYGDGITDDSDIIQNVLKVIYPEIANRIQNFGVESYFNSPRYKITKEILVPPYANLVGNRAILLGNAKTKDCFRSARYIDGVLTDNTSETDLDNPLFYSRVKSFRFRDFDKSIKLKGWTQQCIVDDIESTDCNQHLVTYGCYFLSVNNSTADGVGLGLIPKKPTYVFEKSYGMLKFGGKIQASSCPIAYEFSQEQQAPTLSNLDAESCEIAIRFRNPIDVNNHGGFLITGCYFENCQTILDFVDMGAAVNVILTYTLKNNQINCHDGALARLNNSQNVKVIFNEEDNKVYQLQNLVIAGSSNTILLSDTMKNANYNYTAGIAPNSPLDVTFIDKNIYGANGPTYGHWGQNFQRIVQWDSDSGRVQAKHNDYMRGMIPYTYYGNQGTPQDGTIPFCSHETQAMDSSLMRLRIVTSIISNEMVQASFNLKLRSQATLGFMSGRFYNNKVAIDRNDFTGATFRVAVESGVYVLIVENISSTDASNYSVYGHVKLI